MESRQRRGVPVPSAPIRFCLDNYAQNLEYTHYRTRQQISSHLIATLLRVKSALNKLLQLAY